MASELALKISSAAPAPVAAFSAKKIKIERTNSAQGSIPDGNSFPRAQGVDQSQSSDQTLDLRATVNKLNEITQSLKHELNFSIDESSGEVIIKVVDMQTKEVIRQIPTEAVQAVLQNMIDNKNGLLREHA